LFILAVAVIFSFFFMMISSYHQGAINVLKSENQKQR
jgi:hypothetical protein